MAENLYFVLSYIVYFPDKFGIPVNIWVLMVPFAAPPLVLLVAVNRTARTHIIRIVGAVALTYALLLLGAHSERILEWLQSRACLEHRSRSDFGSEVARDCTYALDVEDVVKIALLVLFGPLLAAVYVGLLEGVWRLWHRRKISELGDKFEGRSFSNAVIFAPLGIGFLFVCLVMMGR